MLTIHQKLDYHFFLDTEQIPFPGYVIDCYTCSGEVNVGRSNVCYVQACSVEISYHFFHSLSLKGWLYLDTWSVACTKNGRGPPPPSSKYKPCYQLDILWERKKFLLHLATDVWGLIRYWANVNSSKTVKKGMQKFWSIYYVTRPYIKAARFHGGKRDTWVTQFSWNP